jgi:hypothetical protein
VIVQWLLGVGANLVHWLLGTLPVMQVPDWLSASDNAFTTVFSAAGSMGVWFPAPLLVVVLGALLVFWLSGFAIKLGRMVLSVFTAGGGSAG